MNNMLSNMLGRLGGIGNIPQLLQQFQQNPIGVIMGMGYDVPPHLRNNFEGTVNYLRNSGKMSDQQFNQFSQLAQMFPNIMNNRGM